MAGEAQPKASSDEELLRRTAAGDRSAFAEFVTRHAGAVLRMARVFTRDHALAEDALQQTFLTAYQGAKSFRGDASARTWLLTIARNTALRMAKRQTREEPVPSLFELGAQAGWGVLDPESLATIAERRTSLLGALAELPSEQQAVIVLRDLEQLTGPETAEVLGLDLAATKSRLHRARLRLAATLRRNAREKGGLNE
ncbi:MAG: sigma-70 family RNA polymerase sigma factor [Myxococcota bacterium]